MAEPGLEIEYLLPSTKPGKSLMSCATKGTGVPRCVPRITQLLALALKLQGMLREGVVQDYAEIARLGHVSRSRVSQIMSLLQPAPDLQEELLFVGEEDVGRTAVTEPLLRRVAQVQDWEQQRWLFREVLRKRTKDKEEPGDEARLSRTRK